jgi:hypothetical protein
MIGWKQGFGKVREGYKAHDRKDVLQQLADELLKLKKPQHGGTEMSEPDFEKLLQSLVHVGHAGSSVTPIPTTPSQSISPSSVVSNKTPSPTPGATNPIIQMKDLSQSRGASQSSV